MLPLKMSSSSLSSLLNLCILALCITEAIGGLPSSINTCSRNLPAPEKCILDEINKLRPNLATGNLGDGVKTVPLEPLALDIIHFKRGPDFTATFNNILVSGPSTFTIPKMKADIQNLQFNFTVHLPKLTFTGKYSLKMRLLLFNIQGKGPMTGVLENTRANVRLIGTKEMRHGKEYVKFTQLTMRTSVGKARFHLDNLFNGDQTLGQIGNTVINENAQLFVEEMTPGIEKSLSKTFLEIASGILTDVTFDEMFPDV